MQRGVGSLKVGLEVEPEFRERFSETDMQSWSDPLKGGSVSHDRRAVSLLRYTWSMIDELWLVVLVEDDTTWLRLSLAAIDCNWNGIRQGELDASILKSPKTIIRLDWMPSRADSSWAKTIESAEGGR